jgi:hypothetical protein
MTENTPPSESPQQPQEPQQPPGQQQPPAQQPPTGGGQGQAPPQGPAPAAAGEVSKDARTFGMLCHLLALAGYVIPLGNVIGPLVMWLIKKDEHPFVDDQGRESLNWQITLSIAGAVLVVLAALTFAICIGVLFMVGAIALGVVGLVFMIIGAVKANQGEWFRYPWSIKFLK